MNEPLPAHVDVADSLRELSTLKAALDEHAIVAITDPRGRINYVNDKFCKISQYSRDELLGQDHRIINSGFHSKDFIQHLWTSIAGGQPWHGEIRNRAKDGSFYWVDTTIVPFLNEQGRPKQYVAIRADITERKRAEEALARTADELATQAAELARSNKDLEQFAYAASHDLQEPLRAVAGCLQILQKRYGEKLDAKADELIFHAVDGANRMQLLIEGLLMFSRVGTRGAAFAPMDCAESVRNAIKNLESTIRETRAKVIIGELPSLLGDTIQITLLFQNLIGNGIKFSKTSDPEIHIAAVRDGNNWDVFVKDNGIGIDPRHHERIFGIFQRLHTRSEYPGTGIGLAICKRIVERHNGRIWVDSAAGSGATFHCSLPAAN